jgi:hypothetical protein
MRSNRDEVERMFAESGAFIFGRRTYAIAHGWGYGEGIGTGPLASIIHGDVSPLGGIRMERARHASRTTAFPWHEVRIGALLGIVAALVMGLFAMIASATYHDTGFFTPLHHIASALIAPDAMMRSMESGMAGDTFEISVGPALLGLGLHLVTGAFWGAVFGLLVSTGWLRGVGGLLGGVVFGLAVMAVMAFVALPLIASVFGGGEPISDMPRLAGWGTFAIEHAIYGAVLGLWPLRKGSELASRDERPGE